MKLVVLSIACLFPSCYLAAQVAAPAQFQIHVSSGCPVSMRLNQAFSSASHLVGNSQNSTSSATWLHLVLSRGPNATIFPPGIRSADVTVHGYNSEPRFELVSPGDAPIVRSLHVGFTFAGNGEVSSNFAVSGLASAGWLEIVALNFANGKTWMPARGETCTVAPSLIKLVEQRGAAGR